MGDGHVDLKIPRLMLLGGTYDVTAAVYSADGLHPFDHVPHLFRFDVDTGDPLEENGVVSLGGTWEGEAFASSSSGSGRAERRLRPPASGRGGHR